MHHSELARVDAAFAALLAERTGSGLLDVFKTLADTSKPLIECATDRHVALTRCEYRTLQPEGRAPKAPPTVSSAQRSAR